MLKRHILVSTVAFLLVGLLGTQIGRFPWGRSTTLDDVWITLAPAAALAAGGLPDDLHDKLMVPTLNIGWFGFWGLLVGVITRRGWIVVALYLVACALIGWVAAWGSGFSLAYFHWKGVAIACALYWMPFWAVLWSCNRLQRARAESTVSIS